MVEQLISAIAIFDAIFTWGVGWRYLLSSKFREGVKLKWQARPRSVNIREAAFYVVVFLVINGIVLVFATLIFTWLFREIVLNRNGG